MFALAAAVAFLASSAVAQYTCSRNYTVAAGDTCDGISRSVSVSTYQLAMLNPTIDDACSNLDVGESLCLGLTDGSDCETTYTVSGGDSCDAITAQFAINSTFLYMNNPQIDGACDNIYVGEVLCVGNKLYTLPSSFTGANAAAPSIAISTSSPSSAAHASTAPAANAAGDPTGGVTLVTVSTTAVTTSSASSTSSSSSATPTSTASDDDCDDDDDDA